MGADPARPVRAPCRVCRRPAALTTRGRAWWHTARGGWRDRRRCPGAGLPPLGAPWDGPEPAALPGQWLTPPPWLSPHQGAGTVYLLHFAAPLGHARHYLGWAGPGNLGLRLAHHGTTTGANLMLHVAKAGIGWELSRTWPGDRHLERRLKNLGGHRRVCPVCRPELADALASGEP